MMLKDKMDGMVKDGVSIVGITIAIVVGAVWFFGGLYILAHFVIKYW